MENKKPIIGISASIIVDNGGIFPGYRRTYVNEDYVLSVIQAGGVPVVLAITDNESIIESYVDTIDGLILSGGHDISPEKYGEEPLQKLGDIYPERDDFDFKLLEKAKEKNIPILGICRGFQAINVYHDGSLYQDLSYRENTFIKHSQGQRSDLTTHSISVKKDSKLFDILQNENVRVNSFHHQVLKEVAKDFEIVATAQDGVIEAIEHKEYDFLIGVQWHPEMLHRNNEIMQNIFKRLIEKSRK